MDLLFWLILFFVIILFGSRLLPVKGVQSITTKELKELICDQNKQFIDVRTPGEYHHNHIKQFNNIPLHQLGASIGKLDRSKETVLICQSGMRSLQAAKRLKKAGFTHIINVKNGMNAWY